MAMLTDKQRDVVARLGVLTGETTDQVVARLGRDAIPDARVHLSPTIPNLLETQFTDAGVREGLPYVTLPNGRVLYGLPSERTHIRQHQLLRGLLDERISEQCFLVALDVVYRYAADRSVPVELLPDHGGVIVEVGAFLGHKGIRMMDASIGTSGHYIGIELMPENCEIMTRNFLENGFDNTEVVPEGVWNGSTRLEVMGKGRQRHTLVGDVDGGRLAVPTGFYAPVSTLEELLERTLAAHKAVDFMYVSVNGAELEALEGLGDWARRVRSVVVATNYARDGVELADPVHSKVRELGFEVRGGSGRKNVIGVRS